MRTVSARSAGGWFVRKVKHSWREGGRPERWDRHLVLDAIFSLVRGGITRRAPSAGRHPQPRPAFGPWASILPE
ncbi:hypothetical protein ACFYQA_19540 [Streptomyces sp. NPDC005774]|uniref:hypothetical protein n=1 Tax=Streptomyces sp. NPDC005774 TaxID=3364728 RepID=UPI00368B876C